MRSPRINTINKSRRIRPKKKSLRRKSKRSKPRKKSRAVKKSWQLGTHNRKMSRCKPINRKSKKVRTRPKKIKNKRSVRRKTSSMDLADQEEDQYTNNPRAPTPYQNANFTTIPANPAAPTSWANHYSEQDMISWLEAFYRFHNPGNLNMATKFVRKYKGRYEELVQKLYKQYNIEDKGFSPGSLVTPREEIDLMNDIQENSIVWLDVHDDKGNSTGGAQNRMDTEPVGTGEWARPFPGFPGGLKNPACPVQEINLPMKNKDIYSSQVYIEFTEGIKELEKICEVYNNSFNNQPTPAEANEAVKFKDYFNETLNGGRENDNFSTVVETIIESLSANITFDICCNPGWIESFLTILETLETNGNLSNLLTQYLGFDGANIELFSDIMNQKPLSMYRLNNVIKYVNYLIRIVRSLYTLATYIDNKPECGTPQGEGFKYLEEITGDFYHDLVDAMRIFLELYTILRNLKYVVSQHSARARKNVANTLTPTLQYNDYYNTKCCVDLREGSTDWIIPKTNPPSAQRIVNFLNKLTSEFSFDLKIPTADHEGRTIKSYIKNLGTFIDAVSVFSNIKYVAADLLRITQENIQDGQLENAISTQIHSTTPRLQLITTVNTSGIPIFVLDSMHDLSRISDLQIAGEKIKHILVANLNKLMSDYNYGPTAYSHPEQLSGLYGLLLKKEIDNQNNKDSLLILTNADKPSQFELMTPDEYFSNDLPFNATASPPSISSIVGTAKTITAQDTNGKIGGKDSNIQCAYNNTLCSIDAGGSSKNFDSEQQWFRLDQSLQQPVTFRIELVNLIVEGNITGPGGFITVKFLVGGNGLKYWNGSTNIEYASIRVNNIKNTGIDNKTCAIISYIIHYIVTNGLGARARAPGNLTHGWHSIENFRAFFSDPRNKKQGNIPQPADLNKIAISKNCTLTIETNVFNQRDYVLTELNNNHIAVAPLLLKFYGDQTFRITASYASKLNQIYQAKTSNNLNQIFTNNPANALTVNIASSDYIHFISTLCHDVGFTQTDLEILRDQHTDQDIPIPQDGTMEVYNELPLLLGENIPGAQLREDSMAKPNITVILAQDDVQKTVLSAFCGRPLRGFANDEPNVGEFMSRLAKYIINDVKNNLILQRAYKQVLRNNQQIFANAAMPHPQLNSTHIALHNVQISMNVNSGFAQLDNSYYEIRIESLEQLYNINFDPAYPEFRDLDTSGTQYEQVKRRLGYSTFTPLKFKVKVFYTGYGFEDKINSNTLLTELMIDDRKTHDFIKNIFNIGVTFGTFTDFTTPGHDDGAELAAAEPDEEEMLQGLVTGDDNPDADQDQGGRSSGPFKLKGLILANHLAYIRDFTPPQLIPVINPRAAALQPGGN
jgi:hypothetical protein